MSNPNSKGKGLVPDLSSANAGHTPSPDVDQVSGYDKRALNTKKVWQARPKSVNAEKTDQSTNPSVSSDGQWIEFKLVDENGKPKTMKAWVPTQN